MRSIKYFVTHPKDIIYSLVARVPYLWPDKLYLKLYYKMTTGERLNLTNPKTFNEKLQWLKLYDRKPEYTVMVDKIEAKKWVAEKIGKQYIIPTLGCWSQSNHIDFDSLPNQFVLKTNHDSGGIIICKDKSKLDIEESRRKLNDALKTSLYIIGREWPYKNVYRKVFAEKLLQIPDKEDLIDYKIFCFNGEPKYIQVIQDRNILETIDFFDTNWIHQPFVGLNPKCKNAKEIPSKPDNLGEMLNVAKKLSTNIPFLRVDLYNIESKIYFGELTFYPACGFGRFTPKEWSQKLGDLIILPKR